jgi:hypothetical protein
MMDEGIGESMVNLREKRSNKTMRCCWRGGKDEHCGGFPAAA